ncbi:MAG: NACHT domain-containing protein, partial [Geitlerinemataceae cyanobacterium]
MEITKRLQQSLHNAVRLTLGMERRDDAVSLPWEAMWYRPEKPPEPLPAGTRVSEVFAQTRQQLLILGEPGSGKTTTMLELARDLLEKAKADNSQPIPVLVSLSSWKKPEVGIFGWLVAELKAKYGLRQDIGKAWMQNRVLLPLLDGLDEVTPALQQKCAEAMNAWLTGDLENQPCGVLICCRREEFETIVREKLSLQGAIYLQPLTPAQIEEYFSQLNLQEVWQTLGDDAALRELLTKPLFLSMFGLVQVQGKFELAAWQAKATSEAKIEYLFDTYWDAVMSRDLIFDPHEKKLGWQSKTYKTKPLPERKVVRRMLVFVAQGMERDPNVGTELLIEKMQPSWLPKRGQKIILGLILGLIGGLILGLIWGLIG